MCNIIAKSFWGSKGYFYKNTLGRRRQSKAKKNQASATGRGGESMLNTSSDMQNRHDSLHALPPREEREYLPAREHVDEPFTVLVLLLLAVGLICLFSASYTVAYYQQGGDSTHFALRQALFAAAGVVVMFAASKFNYHRLKAMALPIMGVTLVLLASRVFLPGAWVTIKGATRWINLGFTTFQPSEIAKFAVIVFFAALCTNYGHKKMKTFKYGLLPFVVVIGMIAGLLYLQPHLSATIIIFGIGIVIIFMGGANLMWIVGGGVAGVAAVAVYITTQSYANKRILGWLDPFDPAVFKIEGWQGAQSLMAIGSGGLWGLGLGQSRQKHLYLPEPANDFIFPVICEELGFVGAALIIILFAVLICRGYYIAFHAEDRFGTLLAAGITTQIAIQVVLNLFVVTGMIPVTGVSLPFFSYGGTSLLMLLGEVGILLNVSRHMRMRESA